MAGIALIVELWFGGIMHRDIRIALVDVDSARFAFLLLVVRVETN